MNALGVFGETTTASGTLPRLCVTVQKPLPSVTQVACAAWTTGAGDGPTAAEDHRVHFPQPALSTGSVVFQGYTVFGNCLYTVDGETPPRCGAAR
ncbi:hypothetical protein Amsp01_052940 [Amycolatopsis sp. NBRC 101858]|nr:hypothetical protein Amsp01_052940 [Amycolatopsis sp. NBRC 101858]